MRLHQGDEHVGASAVPELGQVGVQVAVPADVAKVRRSLERGGVLACVHLAHYDDGSALRATRAVRSVSISSFIASRRIQPSGIADAP